MTVSVEKLSELKRKITLTLQEQDIEQDVAKQLGEMTSKVKLKGFRPGKVPLVEVKRRYGKSIRDDVINNLVGVKLEEAVKEQGLKPAGPPHIEPKASAGSDGPVQFEATFEVYPEIKLASLKGAKLESPIAEVSSADVDKMIDKMRHQHAEWTEVSRSAKEGDKLVIDFIGKMDGKEFEGGNAKEVDLELGSKMMIPGFEEGLIGAEKDQVKTISLTFPEEYHAKEFAGKSVEFEVTVHKITESKLPAINDDFALKFGVKEGGEAALRKNVEDNMRKEVMARNKESVKKELMDILLEKNEFEVPTALVDREVKRAQEEFVERMGGGNKSLIDLLPREHFEQQAIHNVKLGLLFSQAIETNELKVDENRVLSKLEEFASTYEHPEQMIDLYKANPRSMDYFRSSVLEDQVVEHLLSDVEVTEKQVSYDELMNPTNKEA